MIPDNYTAFDDYESEIERQKRRQKRIDRIERINNLPWNTVPDDYGTHEDCYPNKED